MVTQASRGRGASRRAKEAASRNVGEASTNRPGYAPFPESRRSLTRAFR
jgi:hypothetical protein